MGCRGWEWGRKGEWGMKGKGQQKKLKIDLIKSYYLAYLSEYFWTYLLPLFFALFMTTILPKNINSLLPKNHSPLFHTHRMIPHFDSYLKWEYSPSLFIFHTISFATIILYKYLFENFIKSCLLNSVFV